MATDDLFLRPATTEDIPAMVSVWFSAFSSSPLNQHCFPASSPEVHTYVSNMIATNLAAPENYLVAAFLPPAVDSASPTLVGWTRWVRKPAPPGDEPLPPPLKFTARDYPSAGDGFVAAAFFQANYDAARRLVGREDHWFMSTLVTGVKYQRLGVGAALMQSGLNRADRESWVAYVNASEDGRRLYESFGFREVDRTEFPRLGMTQYHMKREARNTAHKYCFMSHTKSFGITT